MKKKATPTKASAFPEEGHRAFPENEGDPARLRLTPREVKIYAARLGTTPRELEAYLTRLHAWWGEDLQNLPADPAEHFMWDPAGPPEPDLGGSGRRLLIAELAGFGLDAGAWLLRSKRHGITWSQCLVLTLHHFRRRPPRNKKWAAGYDETLWARWAAKNPGEAYRHFVAHVENSFLDYGLDDDAWPVVLGKAKEAARAPAPARPAPNVGDGDGDEGDDDRPDDYWDDDDEQDDESEQGDDETDDAYVDRMDLRYRRAVASFVRDRRREREDAKRREMEEQARRDREFEERRTLEHADD